jgi:hypothetical protein
MEIFIKDNTKMDCLKEKESIFGQHMNSTRDRGHMVIARALVSTLKEKIGVMKGIILKTSVMDVDS